MVLDYHGNVGTSSGLPVLLGALVSLGLVLTYGDYGLVDRFEVLVICSYHQLLTHRRWNDPKVV